MIYRDSDGVEHRHKGVAYIDSPSSVCKIYGGLCTESVEDEILYRCVLCHAKDIEDKYCMGITQQGRRCKAIINDIDYYDEYERSRFRSEAWRTGYYKIEEGNTYTGKGYCHHHTQEKIKEGRAFNIEMLDDWMDSWQKITILRSMKSFWDRLNRIQNITISGLRDLLEQEPDKYVYFIKCGNYVKIGKSKDPRIRFKEVTKPGTSTLHPKDIDFSKAELLGYVPGDYHLESYLHSELNSHRVAGEWFRHETHVSAVIDMLLTNSEDTDNLFSVIGLVKQTIENLDVAMEQSIKDREDYKNGDLRRYAPKIYTGDIYEVEEALESAEFELKWELEKQMEV